MKELEDITLLEKLRSGSRDAFTALYNRYWDKLFVIASHRLNSPQEAEEVVQEVFYNIWKHRAALHIHTSLPAYLATAVKYEVLNQLARKKRFQRYELHAVHNAPLADLSAGERLQFNDLQQQLQATIRSLPEQCRIVYRLSREQGYSRKEIATHLDISEKTVANHLTRALKVLRISFSQLFRVFMIFF